MLNNLARVNESFKEKKATLSNLKCFLRLFFSVSFSFQRKKDAAGGEKSVSCVLIFLVHQLPHLLSPAIQLCWRVQL